MSQRAVLCKPDVRPTLRVISPSIPAGTSRTRRRTEHGESVSIEPLALEPELLVCDEPTSALDVSIQAQILALLSELQDRIGFSMIFITHNLAVAQRLTDRSLVMNEGRVVETGSTREVFANPRHEYTRTLLRSVLPVRGAGRTMGESR